MTRTLALLGKELADVRQNLGIFVPAMIVVLFAILIPVMVAVVVPAVTGERLSESGDLEVAVEMYKKNPSMRSLDPEAAIQAYVFQYFLVMLVLGPITSAMSVAAASVISEKQARTLEPLLVTPITTFELLAGKLLGALLPSLALTVGSLMLYLGVVAVTAERRSVRSPARRAIAWRRVPARTAGRDGRAADGAVCLVARQRPENRAAARGLRHPARFPRCCSVRSSAPSS